VTLEAGWLEQELESVSEDVNRWPDWMKREAGFNEASARAADNVTRATDNLTESNDAGENKTPKVMVAGRFQSE
jgi:hypothetical protein